MLVESQLPSCHLSGACHPRPLHQPLAPLFHLRNVVGLCTEGVLQALPSHCIHHHLPQRPHVCMAPQARCLTCSGAF